VPRFPDARELIKPTAFHSIRVSTYLYENWYSEIICLAWLLHDILEDTETTEQEIREMYGKEVLEIVLANTKNMNIANKEDRNRDLVDRCVQSKKALIVKCADIMDNYKYRTRLWDSSGLEKDNELARMIQNDIPPSFSDKIFWEFFALVLGN
jgi:(p)ppGpp synthase/HD superfamily hydrolase